nr:5086_t:CDS:2 [Entrophospora candida]
MQNFDVWDAKSNHIKPGKELYNVTSMDAAAISSAFGVEILERFGKMKNDDASERYVEEVYNIENPYEKYLNCFIIK